MTDRVATFEVDGESYNVARASAVQQDEVLSLLTVPLVQRLTASPDMEVDEDIICFMFMSLALQQKQALDRLLMARITRSGQVGNLSIKDFDDKVLAYNRLRAKVLIWNLSDFFQFWAESNKKPAS